MYWHVVIETPKYCYRSYLPNTGLLQRIHTYDYSQRLLIHIFISKSEAMLSDTHVFVTGFRWDLNLCIGHSSILYFYVRSFKCHLATSFMSVTLISEYPRPLGLVWVPIAASYVMYTSTINQPPVFWLAEYSLQFIQIGRT